VTAFALGSVTADLLTCAPCPVWVSLHNERGPSPLFRRILRAADLSDGSDNAFHWALAFAEALNATCDVIHVSRGSGNDVGQIKENSPPSIEREALDRIRTERGSRGRIILASGEIVKTVSGSCMEARADLLVVGRSRAGNEIDRVQSASYALVYDAPCPVVSIFGITGVDRAQGRPMSYFPVARYGEKCAVPAAAEGGLLAHAAATQRRFAAHG